MKPLSEIEEDAFKEIFNIGVGHAADSFSRMVNQPVRLSVPTLKLLHGEQVMAEMPFLDMDACSMVIQGFQGGFSADGVFLFSDKASLELLRLLVGKNMPISEMRELEQEAFIEVSNILFNSCVSVISDMIGVRFQCGVPRYLSGKFSQLMPETGNADSCLLLVNIDFIVECVQIHGYIIFLMKLDSVDFLLRVITKYMGLHQ